MSINGIMNNIATATTDTPLVAGAKNKGNGPKATSADIAAVFEQSAKTDKKYVKDTDTIARMKAEAEEKTAQFRKLVEQLITKQAGASTLADDFWKQIADGNFTADAATIKQAQEDVSEDGYWGVEQTSQRIFDFAKALTGGDPEKMDDMLEAFKKGFDQATKAWGKELPDISSRTYDAVMKKFEDYANPEVEA
ncbi:MAG: hypothetical protein IJW18_08810 [Lachnospiraceae bacterium]|nr:hypothetical protein [Lachnospiraceae bacterium]